MREILAGIRVADFGAGFAGDLATMILADAGATVVKVEPTGGEWAREGPGHRMWNRGKRSVVLDLETRAGRERAQRLVSASDVAVVSWRPGVTARLGLDLEALAAANPTLVRCSITGFGPLESLAEIPGYEAVVAARAGLWLGLDAASGVDIRVQGDGRPRFKVVPVNSYAAAQLAVQGIVAALVARERTGRGQAVATSLLEGAAALVMREGFVRHAGSVVTGPSLKSVYRGIMLTFLTVECGDGKWIQMCARQDHHFRNWLRVLGLASLLEQPRFARAPLGIAEEDADELERLLRERMRERPQDEWMAIFIENDIGADPFLKPAEFMVHPQLAANGRTVQVVDPEVGPTLQLAPLFGASDAGDPPPAPAPRLGEFAPEFDAYLAAPRLKPEPATPFAPRAALAGKTVLDVAYFLAGPVGPTLMAEFGARVIKVEPLSGDPFRRSGVEWAHLGHGKESIAVDLKAPEGRLILQRLIARADALLHSFRPGVDERLGFDYEAARAINPRIIYVYAAAYGRRGPHAQRPAFHSTPNALVGAGILQAGEGNDPVDDSWPDPVAACAVGTALALGLWWQERTGRGRYIETNMLASGGYAMSERLVLYPGAPDLPVPDREQQGTRALYRLYRSAKGWIFLAVRTEREWKALIGGLNRPDLASKPEFADAACRRRNDAALALELAATFASAPAVEWADRLGAAGVACVLADELDFPHFMHLNGLLTPCDDPNFGPYYRLPPKVRMSSLETRVGDAPAIGQHTAAVLRELDYDKAAIRSLAEAGVIRIG